MSLSSLLSLARSASKLLLGAFGSRLRNVSQLFLGVVGVTAGFSVVLGAIGIL